MNKGPLVAALTIIAIFAVVLLGIAGAREIEDGFAELFPEGLGGGIAHLHVGGDDGPGTVRCGALDLEGGARQTCTAPVYCPCACSFGEVLPTDTPAPAATPVACSVPTLEHSPTPSPVPTQTPDSTATPPGPSPTPRSKDACNRGLGNGPEACDPGNSTPRPGNAGERNEPAGPPGLRNE